MLKIEQIISLSKRRGFIFPGSEIYGGLANSWDYGPLGVELKNNIKNLWWKSFVHQREDMIGLDSAILMNPTVWQSSGHLSNFVDPLMDCKNCKHRFRADHLLEDFFQKKGENFSAAELSLEKLKEEISKQDLSCLHCGEKNFTAPREFHLMFETRQGTTIESSDKIYLRPETAQGIFVNFKNLVQSSRKKFLLALHR